MANTTSRLEAEERAVRELYAALVRNDIPAVLSLLDPGVEFIEQVDYPEGGKTHGLSNGEALLIRARGTWADGGCEPEWIAVAGDKTIPFDHALVRLKLHDEWIDGRLADIFTFRTGKITLKRTFDEVLRAFEWVGVEAPEAI